MDKDLGRALSPCESRDSVFVLDQSLKEQFQIFEGECSTSTDICSFPGMNTKELLILKAEKGPEKKVPARELRKSCKKVVVLIGASQMA